MNDKEDEESHETNWGKVLLAGHAGYELCCAVVLCKCVWSDKVVKFQFIQMNFRANTLPETNAAPENGWLEDDVPFGMAHFQGLC